MKTMSSSGANAEGTYVLGLPSKEPRAIMDALIVAAEATPSVRAMHLAQIFFPENGRGVQPLVGIVLEATSRAGVTERFDDALAKIDPNENVRLALLPTNRLHAIARFLRNTSAFYEA
jgi:hypothetical protein